MVENGSFVAGLWVDEFAQSIFAADIGRMQVRIPEVLPFWSAF